MLEALNLIEALKIDQRSPYWTDPSVFQDLSRVLECVAIAPYIHSYIADAAFQNGAHLSLQDRATKAYAKAAVTIIDQLFNTAKIPQPGGHSDAIVIIDRWGNVAALTHSINTSPWGTTGIVVEGVPLSDAACFQQYILVTLAPGARVPNQIEPIIVMTGGKPSLAVSSIGASLLPETVRVLLGSLGNHLDLQTILAAPPLLLNFDYSRRDMVQVPERYDSDFLTNLGARGFTIQTKSREEMWGIKGTVAIGTIAAASGLREGVEVSGLFSFAEAIADSPQSGQNTAKNQTSATEVKHYENSERQFALDVPSRWNKLPPDSSNSPFEVVRFDLHETGVDNLLIIFRQPIDPKPSLSEWAEEVREVLAQGGFGDFLIGKTTIGSSAVVTLDFDKTVSNGGTWSCRYYFIADGAHRYILGFGTDKRAEMIDSFDRIAKSFQVLK